MYEEQEINLYDPTDKDTDYYASSEVAEMVKKSWDQSLRLRAEFYDFTRFRLETRHRHRCLCLTRSILEDL
jgi:hypothetical protein